MRVITAMNYEQLDLNLLTVFDAVMTELNVTRAADRLHMTQPAVSNALKRLRNLLNDELFIKVPSGVSPTPKAIKIWHPIREALAQIRRTLELPIFDPATTAATFTIAMNDFVAALLLPQFVTVLEEVAPLADIRTVPTTNINAPMLLEQAEIDLAIGVFPNPSSRLRSHTLLTSPLMCVMRRDHPLANKKLTLQRYVQAKHLLVTLSGEPTGFIDRLLQERGLTRRIALTVNQFAIAPQLIAKSDLMAILPTRIVQLSEFAEQLHLAPPPIEIAPSIVKMMWHERHHANPALQWLRSRLTALSDHL
jgi:DNA-binding transcriptional LysR family regulator